MKKFSLSTQLLIVFISILFLTSILFSVLTYTKIISMADSQVLKSLSITVNSSKSVWNNTDLDEITLSNDSNMTIAYIRATPKKASAGDNITNQSYSVCGDGNDIPFKDFTAGYPKYLLNNYNVMYSEDNFKTIIGQQASQELLNEIVQATDVSAGFVNENRSGTSTRTINGKTIYLAYEHTTDDVIFIAFTNSTYAHVLRTKWMEDIVYIFVLVLLVAAIIIFIWSKYYTTRLFRLNVHIKNLDKNNYELEYVDEGKDELSSLSKSVDEMRKTIKENEEEKRELLQNVSHDFKTPISVIMGYAEAIKDGVEDISKADVIIDQANILKNKVYKLLQYNKLEYLAKEKEFEDVPMKSIIEHVMHNYNNLENIDLILDLDDSTFTGYAENFYTVVDNIMENAKRYAKSCIKVTLKKGILTFYNDGDNIDEKFLNASFKAYEMGSKGQFGLGMSIVKKTLDFFEYEISVKNMEPGVMFTINKKQIINPSKL